MKSLHINSNTLLCTTKTASFLVKLAGMENTFGNFFNALQQISSQQEIPINAPELLSLFSIEELLSLLKKTTHENAIEDTKYTIGKMLVDASQVTSRNEFKELVKNLQDKLAPVLDKEIKSIALDQATQKMQPAPEPEEKQPLSEEDAPVLPKKKF